MDSLGHQHCTKELRPKITLHFRLLCESKATLPKRHKTVMHYRQRDPEHKPYQCDICGLKYAWKKGLKRHVETIHNPEKKQGEKVPATCEICHKAFSCKGNMARHLKEHQSNSRYKCPECEKTYSRYDYLRNFHMVQEHSKL